MKYFNCLILLVFCLTECNLNKEKTTGNKSNLVTTKYDSTKSFRIDNYWATPKPKIEFNTLNLAGKDTLDLVICADYVYWPFGFIKNKDMFASSILKNFSLNNKHIVNEADAFEIQVLKLKSSKLIFCFDDTDSATHSDIYKGEIYDSEVQFINGLKIGIDKTDFYNLFFDYFPTELTSKYKVVELESCIDGIKHLYTFKNGKLNSVKFISNFTFKADY